MRATEIATVLGADRRRVNSALYGPLRSQVRQDRRYRWYLVGDQPDPGRDSGGVGASDTPLARLCRYYLECLSSDDQDGVSVFAAGRYGVDYAELEQHPLVEDAVPNELFALDATRNLLSRMQRDHRRSTLLLGYPVNIRRMRSRRGWEGNLVEPILLHPMDEDPADRRSPPVLQLGVPQINLRALRSLAGVDHGNLLDEAISLLDELGLADAQDPTPEIDELAARLQTIRPHWAWLEPADPNHLVTSPSIGDNQEPGIYNRAVVVLTERSPYTRGLETELRQLQSIPTSEYEQTAFGAWINGDSGDEQLPDPKPLIEILPLNTEQRQATSQGLENRLTVVTGPPGTGKSQVVTSVLVNAAWRGIRVLFASKNNKAVDVVEARVNGLGPRPVLLRLGSSAYRSKLADYIGRLLSVRANDTDRITHERALKEHDSLRQRYVRLNQEFLRTIEIRNKVDTLEQSVERVRRQIGDQRFRAWSALPDTHIGELISELQSTLHGAHRVEQPFPIRLFWPMIRGRRFHEATGVAQRSQTALSDLEIPTPQADPCDDSIDDWLHYALDAQNWLDSVKQVRAYFEGLDNLGKARPIEDVSRDLMLLSDEIADSSTDLWGSWLRLISERLTQNDRRLLGEYRTTLELAIEAEETNQRMGRSIYNRFQDLFPQIVNHLPCWAVTSLSARGRIPLVPGFFDLLIIDEASQCDIASVLPLLFRSKRAMIIGDPMQLRHTSALPAGQDRHL